MVLSLAHVSQGLDAGLGREPTWAQVPAGAGPTRRGQMAVKHSSCLVSLLPPGRSPVGGVLLRASDGHRAKAGMWANLTPACIRCLQPGLKSSHPEEGASSRESTRARESCKTGALCSEGPLVPGSLCSMSLQGRVPPSWRGHQGASVPGSQVVCCQGELGCVRGGGHGWWSFKGC